VTGGTAVRKALAYAVGFVLIVAVLCVALRQSAVFGVSKARAIGEFRKNLSRFEQIVTYIAECEKNTGETVFIERLSKGYSVVLCTGFGLRQVSLPTGHTDQDVRRLFGRLHYRYITEDDGNGIYFTLQDTGLEWGHGVAYSRDGKSLAAVDIKLIVV
jgi:hypothetical protein